MFAGSIYDTPWANHSRRGWTTLASFGLQAVLVAVLMAIPFVYTTGLPQAHWTDNIVFPYFAPKPTPTPDTQPGPTTGNNNINTFHPAFTVSSEIPVGVHNEGTETPVPPTLQNVGVCVGCPPGISSIPGFNSPWIKIPVAQQAPVLKPVISSIMEGLLIRRVQPTYPPLALQARIQGPVVLQAIIGRDGTIENLHTLSGHPLLVPAAVRAVQQWRYRPYVLNGEPIEVETQVTVNFVLGG